MFLHYVLAFHNGILPFLITRNSSLPIIPTFQLPFTTSTHYLALSSTIRPNMVLLMLFRVVKIRLVSGRTAFIQLLVCITSLRTIWISSLKTLRFPTIRAAQPLQSKAHVLRSLPSGFFCASFNFFHQCVGIVPPFVYVNLTETQPGFWILKYT